MQIIRIKNWLCPSKYRVKELPQFVDKAEKARYFDLKEITSAMEVKQYIEPLLMGSNGSLVFRGINNASFRMFTTVQRQWCWNGYDAYFSDIPSYIRYQIGRVREDKYLKEHLYDDNDYNILAMIQHFWGNSNLLDFSYSLKSAMFFAWENHKSQFYNDGSLNDFISLYVLDASHPILAGPTAVSLQGAIDLQKYVTASGLKSRQINATGVLNDLVRMPYDVVYDGKLVHGGISSQVQISVPFFNFSGSSQITNVNLTAQNGCFLQGSSDAVPLEVVLHNQHHYYNQGKIIMCYDIHKSLVEDICRNYNIPTDKNLIYPQLQSNKKIYDHVKALDKSVPRKWFMMGCRKLG